MREKHTTRSHWLPGVQVGLRHWRPSVRSVRESRQRSELHTVSVVVVPFVRFVATRVEWATELPAASVDYWPTRGAA